MSSAAGLACCAGMEFSQAAARTIDVRSDTTNRMGVSREVLYQRRNRRGAADERANARVEIGIDAEQAIERGREFFRLHGEGRRVGAVSVAGADDGTAGHACPRQKREQHVTPVVAAAPVI